MISVTKFQMKNRQYDQYEAKSNMKNKNFEIRKDQNKNNKNFMYKSQHQFTLINSIIQFTLMNTVKKSRKAKGKEYWKKIKEQTRKQFSLINSIILAPAIQYGEEKQWKRQGKKL